MRRTMSWLGTLDPPAVRRAIGLLVGRAREQNDVHTSFESANLAVGELGAFLRAAREGPLVRARRSEGDQEGKGGRAVS